MRKQNIVVIGGGTGTFTVLSGLKQYPLELAAVVAMADDGGSTGVLRDELGVLPPGDIRQCLVALSTSDTLMRTLINYRFAEGRFRGHSFGNLLLSALEKVTGSFDIAVEKASEILRLQGSVIPATLDKVSLVAYLGNNRKISGQHIIHDADLHSMRRLALEPRAHINPKARNAILAAHALVIGPGDFYSSIVPNLLVKGMPETIRKSRAKKIYVCNLMVKANHIPHFGVTDFASLIEKYIGCPIHHVIFNNRKAPPGLIARYAREEEYPVPHRPLLPSTSAQKFIGADLLNHKIPKVPKNDLLTRNLIRHDPKKLAEVIISLL